jgi:acyl-CoA thioesterase FadM
VSAETAKEVYEVDYKRPALLGDVVKAKTWVDTTSTHAFDRHPEIVRDDIRWRFPLTG